MEIQDRELPPTPQRFKVLCFAALIASLLFDMYKWVEGMFLHYPAPEASLRAGFYTLELMFVLTIFLMLIYIIWCSFALTDRRNGFGEVHHQVGFPSLALLAAVALYELVMSEDWPVLVANCVLFVTALTILQASAYGAGRLLQIVVSHLRKRTS